MTQIKNASFLLLLLLIVQACDKKATTNKPEKNNIEYANSSIESVIQNMSIEQKVGQMTQVNIDVISKGKVYNLDVPHQIDSAKLDIALNKYYVGSILNAAGYPFSREHWKNIITTVQTKAVSEGSKIPVIYGIDAIHGANYTIGATLFPQQIALAATWNPELVEEAASITAYDVAASGIPWNFSPVLDLARQPLWGRYYETFGEDAVKASNILGIILTKRKNGAAAHIELAGFPHHSINTYLPKLVRAGERVAICDQLEDPKMTKKIVKRGVTELVTPGVSFNDEVLNQKENSLMEFLLGKM